MTERDPAPKRSLRARNIENSRNEQRERERRTIRRLHEVLRTELSVLGRAPEEPKPPPEDPTDALRALYASIGKLPEPLSALCLSGGGIRSATFNLGVLQALARAGLLGKFDYLSSVSGGGYIASWLQGWIKRRGLSHVLAELRSRDRVDPLMPEAEPIDHLREFSNYLSPKLGLFSGDTWSLVAIVARNLLLNWLVVLPLLAALVSAPQLVYLFAYSKHPTDWARWLLYIACGFELFTAVSVHGHRQYAPYRKYGTSRIRWLCVAPVVLAAILLSTTALHADWLQNAVDSTHIRVSELLGEERWRNIQALCWVWCLGIPTAGWLLVQLWSLIRPPSSEARGLRLLWELLALLFSGSIASLLLALVTDHWLLPLYQRPALFCILATPCLIGLYLLARALFVAIASMGEVMESSAKQCALNNDADREWWARLSGWLIGLVTVWILGAALCLFGQWLLLEAAAATRTAVAAAGGITGALGALFGSQDSTPSKPGETSLLQKLALRVAAPVFVACAIALVAWGTASLGQLLADEACVLSIPDDLKRHNSLQCHDAPHCHGIVNFSELGWFGSLPPAFLLLSVLAGTVVNVNRFSLHGLYRNRLVRAYLGASNSMREPDPFTGFAVDDNLRMHALAKRGTASPDASAGAVAAREPFKLLPVVNVTLNLLRDGRLAWQQRQAESFSITPFYCGNFYQGYRSSEVYGGQDGITLGTAMAISGAAANPNMGYCSSPALSFLMTLFNLRLGAWLANPGPQGDSTCPSAGPRQALWALIGELLGKTTKHFKYVNLSDGGHFDNLGLYEMVLRRCRQIVVCDAGRDGSAHFEDLGNAIRKIRIDFGLSVVFDKIEIIPTGPADQGLYCATGRIDYSTVDGADSGSAATILYLKPTLCGRGAQAVPYDIFAYSKQEQDFPHESTADQWFSESQFESYRKLGEHSIDQILGDARPAELNALFDAATAYVGKGVEARVVGSKCRWQELVRRRRR